MIAKLADIALAEVGTREIGGNNCGAHIREFQKATWLEPAPWAWCFTGDIELLTESGWIPFRELSRDNGKVAQVTESLDVEFVDATDYIRKEYTGKFLQIKNRNLDFQFDSGHQWYGRKNPRSPFSKMDLNNIKSFSIPAVKHSGDTCGLSDIELDFIVAFVCDGFIHKGFVEFQVSRERKITRLRTLGTPRQDREALKAYGLSKTPLTHIVFDRPDYFDSIFEEGTKNLKFSFLLSLTLEQKKYLANCFMWWDGHMSRKCFTTVNETTASHISTLVSLSGQIASCNTFPSTSSLSKGRTMYSIRWSEDKKTRTIREKDIIASDKTEEVFCVSVPSGLILVRDKNKNILVTGNCAAFVDWCLMKWIEDPNNTKWLNLHTITPEEWRPKTAGAFDLLNWAKSKPKTTQILDENVSPKKGDIIVFDFSHTGIVVGNGIVDGMVETVEGNTNGKGERDSVSGDGVWHKFRAKSLARNYIRIRPSA